MIGSSLDYRLNFTINLFANTVKPNSKIGRTGSVFQTINVLIRFTFITLFSLTFFAKGNNIISAYFICGLFIFISIFPLLIYYKKLINLKTDEEV